MANYIKDLRKLVGHAPIVLATAGVLLLDQSNRVLLQQRSDNGYWGIPGGIIEFGESVEAAAIREVYEETGLVVEHLDLFKIYSGMNQHYTYPNGDEVSFISILYVSKSYSGQLVFDDESLDMQFFSIDDRPLNIAPTVKPMLEDLKVYLLKV